VSSWPPPDSLPPRPPESGLGRGAVALYACPPPRQRGRNCFERLPKPPTPRDVTHAPRLAKSIRLGPLRTAAPSSPHSHCGSGAGRERSRRAASAGEERSPPATGGTYAVARGGEAALALCSGRVAPSRPPCLSTRCVSPTPRFFHLLQLESRTPLLACCHPSKPSPPWSARKRCPTPVSFPGCSPPPARRQGQSPPARQAQHAVPSRPESCDRPCEHSPLRLAASPWRLDLFHSPARAQPSGVHHGLFPLRGAFTVTCTPCPSWGSSGGAGHGDVHPRPRGSSWKHAVRPARQIAAS